MSKHPFTDHFKKIIGETTDDSLKDVAIAIAKPIAASLRETFMDPEVVEIYFTDSPDAIRGRIAHMVLELMGHADFYAEANLDE